MKFLFFVSLLLSNKSWSQHSILKDQLDKVISEVHNDFKSLKGKFKALNEIGDSVFYSNILLEGTINTVIEKSYDSKSWDFISIIDSSSLRYSKKSIQAWMKKLKSSIGREYIISPIDEKYAYSGSAKGYSFIKENIKILVFYSILSDSKVFSKSYLIISKNEDNN